MAAKRGLASDRAVQGQCGESWPWTQTTIGFFPPYGLQGALLGGELLWDHRKSPRLGVGQVSMATVRVTATVVPPIRNAHEHNVVLEVPFRTSVYSRIAAI